MNNEHVPERQPYVAELLVYSLVVTIDAQNVGAIARSEAYGLQCLAGKTRVRGQDCLDDHRVCHRLRAVLGTVRLDHESLHVLNPEKLVQFAFDEKVVPFLEPRPSVRQRLLAVPDDPKNLQVIGGPEIDFGQRSPGRRGAREHEHLADVLLPAGAVRHVFLFAAGQQPGADQYHEHDPCQRQRYSKRGELEKAERLHVVAGQHPTYRDVGRGPNQGDFAAEHGSERKRHQELRHRLTDFPGKCDHRGHQHGRGDYVRKECRDCGRREHGSEL